MAAIVTDDSIRSGDPRIDGTRVTVFDVKRRVVDAGEDPHVVAGEYDLSMADLFRALAYYYDHRETLAATERDREHGRTTGEQSTRSLLDHGRRDDLESSGEAN